jgi:hypothetical protein
MNRLDLPTTREDITAWVLSQPHNNLTFTNAQIQKENGQLLTVDKEIITNLLYQIATWITAVQQDFPDLYTETQDDYLPMVCIGGIEIMTIHAYRTQLTWLK